MSKRHVCPPDRPRHPYIALVVGPDESHMLVKRQGSEITFPRVESPEIPHRGQHMSDCFSCALERLTGTRYDLLLLYATINETYQRHLWGPSIAIFECTGPTCKNDEPVDPESTEYEWININDMIDSLREHTLEFVSIFDDHGYMTLIRGDNKEFSEKGMRPWETAGWFKRTTEAATSALNDLSYTVTTRFEQHQISSTSAVLRVGTNKGRVYLKASTKREVLTAQCAAGFAPFLVRKPLHVDVEDEWMLMEDYGPTLDRQFSRSDFQNILLLHGKLQAQSVSRIPELIEAGVLQQGPESIMRRAQSMFDDPDIRQSCAKLRELAPANEPVVEDDLTKCCEIVSSFLSHLYNAGVPLALVHGDLYDDNIIKIQGNCDRDTDEYVVYDWGNARIDIPVSDVMFLETEIVTPEKGKKEGIDSYLELWAKYGSQSRLRKLCHCVSAKDDLVRLLDRYEYAKDKRVRPVLEDGDMKYFYNTLLAIQQTKF